MPTDNLTTYLGCMLDFDPVLVARAERCVHLAARRSVALVVAAGPATALGIHRRVSTGPFIVCDHKRRDAHGDVRCSRNIVDAPAAVTAARGGTLCVSFRRMPPGIREACTEAMLTVCTTCSSWPPTGIEPVVPRPLAHAERVIAELAGGTLTPTERELVLDSGPRTVPAVEVMIERVIALRSGTYTDAARMLGMARVSVARWAENKPFRIPPLVVDF